MGFDRQNYTYDSQTPRESMSGMRMLWILIAINIAAYFFVGKNNEDFFALTIAQGSKVFQLRYIWQIFTAGFLHDGFFHIFFNMWGLYIFGKLVANHISGSRMALLYLLGAASGNILFILCNLHPERPMQLVGASGAVCAVMAAAATLEPERRFTMIFMPFTPIKTTTLVICYTILEMIQGITNTNDGIAHLAHLGGFIGGYLIMLCFFGRNLPWDPFRVLFSKLTSPKPRFARPHTGQKNAGQPAGGAPSGKVTQKELDYLLDKLSEQGINSLTEYELDRLRQARKQMRGEE